MPFAGGSSKDPSLRGRVVQSANPASDGRKPGPQEKQGLNPELPVRQSETLLAEAEICFTNGPNNEYQQNHLGCRRHSGRLQHGICAAASATLEQYRSSFRGAGNDTASDIKGELV